MLQPLLSHNSNRHKRERYLRKKSTFTSKMKLAISKYLTLCVYFSSTSAIATGDVASFVVVTLDCRNHTSEHNGASESQVFLELFDDYNNADIADDDYYYIDDIPFEKADSISEALKQASEASESQELLDYSDDHNNADDDDFNRYLDEHDTCIDLCLDRQSSPDAQQCIENCGDGIATDKRGLRDTGL